MTFYWWSHWFWITLLSTLLLSVTFVQTYPSQEISQEYNQHSKPVKTVTKLYQTTTTITWPTTTSATTATTPLTPSLRSVNRQFGDTVDDTDSNNDNGNDNEATDVKAISQDDVAMNTKADKTAQLQDLQPTNAEDANSKSVVREGVEKPFDNDSNDAQEHREAMKEESEQEEKNVVKEYGEHKRSAEVSNKSTLSTANNAETQKDAVHKDDTDDEDDTAIVEPHVAAVAVASASLASVKLKRDDTSEVNNYTNYSNANAAGNSANSSQALQSSIDNTSAASSVSAPAAPHINNNNNAHLSTASTMEWLSAMAAAATAAANVVSPTVTSNSNNRDMVTAAQQRVPFTLENANKEEELRRAENEHRSRKSKVLSAEYKHINRYINFSADTKSLLTRSASTAPSDFNGLEESNISSEALAIQRTYFLDAGTISAICFTIFGVCCTVGTIGIVLYRRRYLNKPQALSEPDSSVYIDDSTMRDNSDEMYSLDNDSFLNSLEAMTIQNYWTDTVKHTKL